MLDEIGDNGLWWSKESSLPFPVSNEWSALDLFDDDGVDEWVESQC